MQGWFKTLKLAKGNTELLSNQVPLHGATAGTCLCSRGFNMCWEQDQ